MDTWRLHLGIVKNKILEIVCDAPYKQRFYHPYALVHVTKIPRNMETMHSTKNSRKTRLL
uniref:Uncharacterized protein n=1 Tax=Arundo donax TaxID=35708 RepID=A0A0A8ZFJ0_ARUDO